MVKLTHNWSSHKVFPLTQTLSRSLLLLSAAELVTELVSAHCSLLTTHYATTEYSFCVTCVRRFSCLIYFQV